MTRHTLVPTVIALLSTGATLLAQGAPEGTPKGWTGKTVKELKATIWTPKNMEVKPDYGPLGDRVTMSMNREGKATSADFNKPKDAKRLDAVRKDLAKKLESKDYAEVDVEGKKGISSIKDGKPVGKVKTFEFYAVADGWAITFKTADDMFTPAHAEHVLKQMHPLLK